MNKRSVSLMAGLGLAVGLAGAVGLARLGGAVAAAGPDQYPGSVVLAGEAAHVRADHGGQIEWQDNYESADPQRVVWRWYAVRLNVSPASDEFTTGGDCAWLSDTRMELRFESATSVLLCTVPHGTRITVNRSLRLLP